MPPAVDLAGPERQIVHRLFTIRWIDGCVHTLLHGPLRDDADSRAQIRAWATTLAEVLPRLGPQFVSIIDATDVGPVPRALWIELVELTRGMVRPPRRRAVITADGKIGDGQAETAQLVTAGNARAFRRDQLDAAIAWLAEAGVVEPATLARFLG